jgi:AbrB family looped-hinge helix DNA binding protein
LFVNRNRAPGALPWFAAGMVLPIFALPSKLLYHEVCSPGLGTRMPTLLVSSKGQIVLPAALRRRLGMGAGARIEVLEESDGLKLRVVRSVATADMAGMAGMVKAPARGVPRRLEDFDPASLLTRSRRGKP